MSDPSNFQPNPHPPAGATRADGTPFDAPAPGDRGQDQFDRAYVEDLRSQAAGYRTAYAPFRDAFGPYTDDERAEWLDLARTFANDPVAGAARLRELADAVAPAAQGPFEPATEGQQAPVITPAAGDDGDRPLTVKEFQALQRQQAEQAEAQRRQYEARAAQEAEVQGIYSEAEKLGYKSGSKQIVDLLWTARNDPRAEGDLTRAHQILEYERQETVRSYLQEKGYDGREIPLPVSRGTAPSGQQEIKTFSDARASLDARLAQL